MKHAHVSMSFPLVLLLIAFLLLTACSGGTGSPSGTTSAALGAATGTKVNPAASQAKPAGTTAGTGAGSPTIKSRAELTGSLANFSFTYIPILDNGKEGEAISFMRTQDAMKMETGNAAMIFDYTGKKIYTLEPTTQTAIEMPYEQAEQYNPFAYFADYTGTGLAGQTLAELQKKGSETIDGRTCSVYESKAAMDGTSVARIYLADDLGIIVKYLFLENGRITGGLYLKNLKTGNVTAQDVSLPAGYQVNNVGSLLESLGGGK